jgi:hypothetical protein
MPDATLVATQQGFEQHSTARIAACSTAGALRLGIAVSTRRLGETAPRSRLYGLHHPQPSKPSVNCCMDPCGAEAGIYQYTPEKQC